MDTNHTGTAPQDHHKRTRREVLSLMTAGAAVTPARTPADQGPEALLAVDPAPRFELSPYLYMQFMEPLGTTDGSVEAAWDHLRDRWREDLVAATRAPALYMPWSRTTTRRPVAHHRLHR